MKKQTKQSGFAHLGIITIILAVALVGTLGYVFYQNFIQNKDDDVSNVESNKDNNSDSTDNNVKGQDFLTYSDDQFTFNYPKSVWLTSLEQEPYAKNIVTIKTNDYDYVEPNPAEGGSMYGSIQKGAIITVYKSDNPQTTKAELYSTLQSQQNNGLIKELSARVVNDESAYSYKFSYEGPEFYQTIFVKNGYSYYVTYKYSDGQSDLNKSTYKLVLDSLLVK